MSDKSPTIFGTIIWKIVGNLSLGDKSPTFFFYFFYDNTMA